MTEEQNTNKVAIYWDFDNIHISAKNLDKKNINTRFKQEPRVLDVNAIMEFIASYGDISINQAYADWTMFSNYQQDFLNYSIDLIQLFPRGSHSKNGADIRMSLDILEDSNAFPHLTHFVIIGGDSDYIGVAQKLKQRGKYIVGIAVEATTNDYFVKACNEFKFYKTILAKSNDQDSEKILEELKTKTDKNKIRKLVGSAIRKLLNQYNTDFVYKAQVKPMIRRLDPKFDESNYGYRTFTEFIMDHKDILDIRDGENDQTIRLRSKQKMTKARPVSPAKKPIKKIPIKKTTKIAAAARRKNAKKVENEQKK